MFLPRSGPPLLLASVLLASLVSCSGPTASAPRTSSPSRPALRDIDQLTTEYLRYLDTRGLKGNLDSFLERWADDLDHTVALATMRNKEELRSFLSEWTTMFSRWRHVEVRRVIEGSFVAWEGFARGTHRTTGRSLEIPMMMLLEFDPEGKVKMSHVYFDSAVIQQQLLSSRHR